jgi:hypothetical protein
MGAKHMRDGAERGTRTPTGLLPLAPQASASASSATSASIRTFEATSWAPVTAAAPDLAREAPVTAPSVPAALVHYKSSCWAGRSGAGNLDRSRRRRLDRLRLKHRPAGARMARRDDSQRQRRGHEDARRYRSRLGKQRCRAPRPEGRLGTHTAKSPGKVSGFAALQQHYDHQKEAHQDVDDVQQSNQNRHVEPVRAGAGQDLPAPLLSV